MPIGPGKYDHLCTVIREEVEAEVAIVMIINGKNGSGFSVQSHNAGILHDLPSILENMADEIRGKESKGEEGMIDLGADVWVTIASVALVAAFLLALLEMVDK